MLYTFRFRPNPKDSHAQDVDIQRIGEEGSEASLEPQGELARVNGFSEHTKDKEDHNVKPLKDWLKKRYHGMTPMGDTIAEVEKDVTAKIRAGSGDRQWYQANYGIKILNKTEAMDRLISIGHKQPEELADLKDFHETELQVLELVLETMSDQIVKTFKGLQLIRQKIYNEWKGPGPRDFETRPKVSAITLMPGAARTIIVFDEANINNGLLFVGGIGPEGKPAVAIESAQVYAHELGHTIEVRPGVMRAFEALVAKKPKDLVGKKPIKPITWYADSDPTKEFFAESFSLYYSDPEWLQQNWPDLFNFFQTLDKKGTP